MKYFLLLSLFLIVGCATTKPAPVETPLYEDFVRVHKEAKQQGANTNECYAITGREDIGGIFCLQYRGKWIPEKK